MHLAKRDLRPLAWSAVRRSRLCTLYACSESPTALEANPGTLDGRVDQVVTKETNPDVRRMLERVKANYDAWLAEHERGIGR